MDNNTITMEFERDEFRILEKSLITTINKADKCIKQLDAKGRYDDRMVATNALRKELLKKMEERLPLDYEFNDTRD